MRRFPLSALTLAGFLVLGAGGLSAQDRPHTREGFFISFGLGVGSLGCEDCDEREAGGAGYLRLGGTVSPRILLGGQSAAWVKEEGGVTLSVTSLAPVIMFYPSETSGFWLLGGIGLTRVELEIGGFSGSSSAGGLVLGLGYDARVGDNFSIAPFANAYAGDFDAGMIDVFMLGLGVTWH